MERLNEALTSYLEADPSSSNIDLQTVDSQTPSNSDEWDSTFISEKAKMFGCEYDNQHPLQQGQIPMPKKEDAARPPKPNSKCLKRLPGSNTTHGPEYEQKLAGLAALRARKAGLRFEVFTNVSVAHPFDDIVLRFAREGTDPPRYIQCFFQLKHSSKATLSEKSFLTDDDFKLTKYFKFYQKLRGWHANQDSIDDEQRVICVSDLNDVYFIIYTTRQYWRKGKPPSNPVGEFRTLLINLIRTGGAKSIVAGFSEKDKKVWNMFSDDEEMRSSEEVFREVFLPRLFIFCGQSMADGLDCIINDELKIIFGSPLPDPDIYLPQYISFLKFWAQDKSRGYCLTESSGELEWILAVYIRKRAKDVTNNTFSFKTEHRSSLTQIVQKHNTLHVQVQGVQTGYRFAKLLQVLEQYFQMKWIYFDSNIINQFPAASLFSVCEKSPCHVVVFDVDNLNQINADLLRYLKDKVKVVLLSSETLCEKSVERYLELTFVNFKDDWRIYEMEDSAVEKIMNINLKFQGCDIRLRDLEGTWPRLREEVDGALLVALVQGRASLGEAPSPPFDDALYIPRSLQHPNELRVDVLHSLENPEHLALSGFPLTLLDKIACEHKLGDAQKNEKWTVLSVVGGNSPDTNDEAFNRLCEEHHASNVHWLENINLNVEDVEHLVITWRLSRGQTDSVGRFVRQKSASCGSKPQCSHEPNVQPQSDECLATAQGSTNAVEREAADWKARGALLVGEAGVGKSDFLRRVAAEARCLAPHQWSIFVELLKFRSFLREMPQPKDIQRTHVIDLLAAAVGIPAESNKANITMNTSTGASRRCLEASLLESGAIKVFMDGVDEVCPAFERKVLRIIELLLKERVELLWVTARPEVTAVLRRAVLCAPTTLRPLSRAEQLRYVLKWAYEHNVSVQKLQSFCEIIVEALAQVSSPHAGNGGGGRSLLDIPLHLQMMCEGFAAKIVDALNTGRGHSMFQIDEVSLFDLYRRFKEEKRNRFIRRHELQHVIENISFSDNFDEVHQNCAMHVLISDGSFTNVDSSSFETYICGSRDILSKEKIGILWIGEDDQPCFSHFTFVQYFAAAWLCENIGSLTAKSVARSMFLQSNAKLLRHFLECMLSEDIPFHRMILRMNEEALEQARECDVELFKKDKAGRSPLHLAASKGNAKLCKVLLARRCEYSQKDLLLGYTPLQYADECAVDPIFRRHYLEVAERLLEGGADSKEMVKIRELMLDTTQRQEEILCDAASGGLYGVTHYLIEVLEQSMKHSKASMDDFGICKTAKYMQLKVCIFAAGGGHIKIVELLLDRGLRVNATTDFGRHPLHSASMFRFYEDKEERVRADERRADVILLLLQRGADPNLPDKNGVIPLHFAVESGNINAVSRLLENGANPNIADKKGLTSLHHIGYVSSLNEEVSEIQKQKKEVIFPLLLERGANHKQLDRRERLPLHYASQYGNERIVKLLVLSGSDVNKQDIYGYSPLHLAAERNRWETVKLLLELGAKELKDKKGQTPLHRAADRGYYNITESLLEKEFNVYCTDNEGREPLYYASQEYSHSMQAYVQSTDEYKLETASLLVRYKDNIN